MRGLDHDAGAITSIDFAAAGAAMFHIFKNGQCIRDMLVTLAAFNAGDETNATGIVFKLGIVQSFVACHRCLLARPTQSAEAISSLFLVYNHPNSDNFARWDLIISKGLKDYFGLSDNN